MSDELSRISTKRSPASRSPPPAARYGEGSAACSTRGYKPERALECACLATDLRESSPNVCIPAYSLLFCPAPSAPANDSRTAAQYETSLALATMWPEVDYLEDEPHPDSRIHGMPNFCGFRRNDLPVLVQAELSAKSLGRTARVLGLVRSASRHCYVGSEELRGAAPGEREISSGSRGVG